MIDIDPTMPLPPPGRVPTDLVRGADRERMFPVPHLRDGMTWRPTAITVAAPPMEE